MGDRVTIVVDTREQLPLSFSSEAVTTVRRALKAGDYSVEGYETSVAVERKTLEDFVSSVIRRRRRFHKELARLAGYDYACVVVEADLSAIPNGWYRGGVHPNAVFGAILAIIVDCGVPVYFCSDRQIACRFIEGFLVRAHRKVAADERSSKE